MLVPSSSVPVAATVGITSSASTVGASVLPPPAVVPTEGVSHLPDVNVSQADELDIPLADLFGVPGLSGVPEPFVFAAPISRGGEDLPPGRGGNATSSGAVTRVRPSFPPFCMILDSP